eukprot:CAMPEP_0198220130 /NCGR_PEP_ID=MMETSP1445-20131203/77694_1 /TAXON_ID=36898 /ORGANISM="Pyramimonas sp., Strain CCMP2087" /LENGTH=138 /DNA_ID=CAMNT_0043897789 /DNA_START=131 /DNA_END=544 /DNA_ORIENTATION=+
MSSVTCCTEEGEEESVDAENWDRGDELFQEHATWEQIETYVWNDDPEALKCHVEDGFAHVHVSRRSGFLLEACTGLSLRAAALMLAAKEGCLDVFDLMMQYVDADEACTEGGKNEDGGPHGCSMLRNTAIIAARMGRA